MKSAVKYDVKDFIILVLFIAVIGLLFLNYKNGDYNYSKNYDTPRYNYSPKQHKSEPIVRTVKRTTVKGVEGALRNVF